MSATTKVCNELLLINACLAADCKTVQKLLSAGGLVVNTSTSEGVTPLMIVAARFCRYGGDVQAHLDAQLANATLLMAHGANVNAQDQWGRTALMYIGAVDPMPSVFVEAGLRWTADRSGRRGRGKMTQVLLSNNKSAAKLHLQDKAGQTALDHMVHDALELIEEHDGIRLLFDLFYPSHDDNKEDGNRKYVEFQQRLAAKQGQLAAKEKQEKEAQQRRLEEDLKAFTALVASTKNGERMIPGPKQEADWPMNWDSKSRLYDAKDVAHALHTMFELIDEARLWEDLRDQGRPALAVVLRHPKVRDLGFSGAAESGVCLTLHMLAKEGWNEFCADARAKGGL